MSGKKTIRPYIAIVSIVTVLCLLGWLLAIIFEGENPGIDVSPFPQFISGNQEFTLTTHDMKRGLKKVEVSVSQEGREISVLKEKFPFKGLFNRNGVHIFNTKFSIDPTSLNLAQGRVDLKVRAWDYSSRGGGDGNFSLVHHKMVVDTIPPAIRALSRMNYVNVGGTGLIVYQTSSDSIESGILVNDLFFPGYPAGKDSQEGFHVCYFAIAQDIKSHPEVLLCAKDRAGNSSRSNFYCKVRTKQFQTERVNITDRYLKRILPYFSFYPTDPDSDDITNFLRINRELRQENNKKLFDLSSDTTGENLWSGTWLRLRGSARMAKFGNRRQYYYKDKKIDEQIHLGVDLASLANSKVQAANNGRVIFATRLGIYGFTVVLDHGQGLASTYSHLSKINVVPGDEVKKGESLGETGQTGIAGGDHLHFGVMVRGIFVNPLEWWDAHWIQDNVTRKLAVLNKN